MQEFGDEKNDGVMGTEEPFFQRFNAMVLQYSSFHDSSIPYWKLNPPVGLPASGWWTSPER
jgi:hypothetical protein